jgi:hypothetical protein
MRNTKISVLDRKFACEVFLLQARLFAARSGALSELPYNNHPFLLLAKEGSQLTNCPPRRGGGQCLVAELSDFILRGWKGAALEPV